MSFVADKRRAKQELKLAKNKQNEKMKKRLQEREKARVMRLFNPAAIRKVAEATDDPKTKLRLLNLLGDEKGNFEELSHAASPRRMERRPSASGRNALRLRTEHKNELRTLQHEHKMLRKEQSKHMMAKLRQRKAQLQSSGAMPSGKPASPPPPPRPSPSGVEKA